MDTKALRQKILDLAIRGKLVPQDPSDEPASVLLEKIREEKARMVKEGKLKKKDIKNDSIIYVGEDNLHYEKFQDGTVKCIEDEIPFEVPEGWAWSRISSICLKVTDGTHHSPENFPTGEYKYVTAKNIKLDGIVLDDITYVSSETHREIFTRCNPEFGDILYIKDGATSGIATVNTLHEEFSLLSSVALLKPAQGIDNWYMCYAMQSPYFYSTTRGDMKGVGITRITLTMLTSRLIPVPPQNEQQQISIKTRNLIELISNIESDKESITKMASNAKSKILDLAIRGKLVPQDPHDEPASVLLERIHAEKELLIKQGKIKRDKKESVIFKGEDNSYYEKIGSVVQCIDSEIPFEIPDSWAYERLGNICSVARGGSPRPIKNYLTDDENGLNWIKIGDTEQGGKYIFSTKEKIRPDGLSKTRYVHCGDFLLTNSMSFGRPYILKTDGCIHDGWLVIGDVENVFNQDFLYCMLSSSAMYNALSSLAVGSTVKNLKSDSVKALIVPIPPIEEQRAIATQVETFLTITSRIEKSLS